MPLKLRGWLILVLFFASCSPNVSNQPIYNDSIVNALNIADTIPKTQQKTIDSVNNIYLDSLKKHMADSTNAEFPSTK